MKIFGLHILTKSDIAKIKADAATFALSEGDKFVAALKATSAGSVVASAIKAIDNKNLTGFQKAEQVIELAVPLVVKFAESGGVSMAISEAKDFARQFVQSTFNDFKNSKIIADVVGALHL